MFFPSSLPLILSILVLFFAFAHIFTLSKKTAPQDNTAEMSEFVCEGLGAFIMRVLSSIIQLILYLSLILFVFALIFGKPFSWIQVGTFFIGSTLTGLGTVLSILLVPRVVPIAVSVSNTHLTRPLGIQFTASAIVGAVVTAMVLFGLTGCYFLFGPNSVIGFGLGVVGASIFLRVGGGIYQTATSIGAALISRIDSKVPTDDRRNPATAMELSGNYVSQIAGNSSDLMGSYVFVMISAILFPYVMQRLGTVDVVNANKLMIIPFFMMSITLVSMLLSYLFCQIRIRSKTKTNFLLEGVYLSLIFSGVGVFCLFDYLNITLLQHNVWSGETTFQPFWAFLSGLVGAVLMGFTSEVFTSTRFLPARRLVAKAEYGAPLLLFSGLAMSLKSNVFYLLYLLLITIPSFYFAGIYGITVAGMGMMAVSGTILMVKAFAPISAHAKTVSELYHKENDVLRRNLAKSSRIGSTTVALESGLVSGSAVIATFSLFFTSVLMASENLASLFVMDWLLLIGMTIGITIPFIFSGYLMQSLYHTVMTMFDEVSRQFKEIPYLYEDQARPDILKAVDTIAKHAMDGLIIPGLILGLPPIIAGFVFGEKLLVGLVLGIFLSGFSQSFYWANFGGSLHNGKQYMAAGRHGGPDSPNYQDMATAASVGEAFRNLLSPSMNILIKSVALIALLVILIV